MDAHWKTHFPLIYDTHRRAFMNNVAGLLCLDKNSLDVAIKTCPHVEEGWYLGVDLGR